MYSDIMNVGCNFFGDLLLLLLLLSGVFECVCRQRDPF